MSNNYVINPFCLLLNQEFSNKKDKNKIYFHLNYNNFYIVFQDQLRNVD